MKKRGWPQKILKRVAKTYTKIPIKKALAIGFIVVVIIIFCSIRVVRNTQGTVYFKLQGNSIVPTNQSLRFEITQDVMVDNATVTLSPDAPLTQVWEKGTSGQSILVVTPQRPLQNAAQYRVSVKGLQRILTRQGLPEQVFVVRTELAPGIALFSPLETKGNRHTTFSLKATDETNAKRNYELLLEPATDLEATFDNNLGWNWKPKKPLKQGVNYKVTLRADGKILQTNRLHIPAQPNVVTATEKNYFYPDEIIKVEFDRPMRTDQPETIFFNLPGYGRWENDKTYLFTPKDLSRNKSFTYNLKAGMASKEGGILEKDRQFAISTPGPATVVGASPYGSSVSRAAHIRIAFDQPIDRASAQAHFRISPAVTGSFRWEGNTMVYIPSGFDFQTTYAVSILPGVVSTYGVQGVSTFVMSFTTEVQTVRLNVPAYRQSHSLSCEASALRMALAYRGVYASDIDIVGRMGYNPRPLTNGQWDNPYNQFVGDINGSQRLTSGYGVYAPPVAKAAQSLGRNASAHYGVGATFLAQQIYAGNPVVIWGYFGNPTPFSWTAGGQTIAAWQGEHTRTVVGVVGKADAPQGFYVIDPAHGSASYWNADALIGNMNVHGGLSNQAVVVY